MRVRPAIRPSRLAQKADPHGRVNGLPGRRTVCQTQARRRMVLERLASERNPAVAVVVRADVAFTHLPVRAAVLHLGLGN